MVVTIAAITAVARIDRQACCIGFAPDIGWTKQERENRLSIGVRALRFAKLLYTLNALTRSIHARMVIHSSPAILSMFPATHQSFRRYDMNLVMRMFIATISFGV